MTRGAFAAIAVMIAALPQSRGAQLPVHLYTTDDGLASNLVNRIVQDSRGFLWFCTREGISRFDGYRFTNFGREQGLPGRDEDLLETGAGEYWIATEDGVARLNPTSSRPEFTLYRPADPKAREITVLKEDGAGGIGCGTVAGLYRLERADGRWALRFVDIGMPAAHYGDMIVEALLPDRGGNLWIGGPSGLYRRSAAGECKRYAVVSGPSQNHVTALLEDREGRLWAGTWEGLSRISMASDTSELSIEKTYTTKNGLVGNLVESLLELPDGQLCIGTNNGLSRYVAHGAREEFENYTVANGLSYNEVRALAEDRAGNLWVSSTGVQKISRGGFVTYGERDGLASNHVASIFEDQAGELCVVTRGAMSRGYLNRLEGRLFHPVLPNIPSQIKSWGWGSGQITLQDHAGEWWVPTGTGLFRFPLLSSFAQLGSVRPEAVYNRRNGLDGENVFRVFEDSRGDVWIATAEPEHGLTRWERASGTLHRYSAVERVDTNADAFAEDRAGNVWIGFWGSLARYRQGRIEFLEASKSIGQYYVRALYLDREGRLWAACRNGLVRIDSPEAAAARFTTYTTAEGLASNDVQCVTGDRWGRIYVGTGRGVDCFYPRMPLRIKHYTKADGLALGGEMTAFADHRGALWFGTTVGLSRLEPEPERPRAPPPILISTLRVRGVPRAISALGETVLSGLELGPDQNQIEMEFVGLGFGTGETLRYQHRLESADTGWSEPTEERPIVYASLSPGSYRFLVRAVANDGLVSARPAIVAFTILAPVWQRWWMRMLTLTLAAAILYTLYLYRLSRLLELERLRTRIATDLHDDIGSTLSQIAILSEVASRAARKEEQREPLSEIANLSRESVDTISDIVWAIDPDQDRLGNLCHRMRRFSSDLFGNNGTRVQFRAPGEERDPEIGAEMRQQIFLIFKETLHNAARHSACTNVEIDFALEKAWLVLTMRDNGKGFDMAQAGNGHGLASIQQRAKLLRGQATLNSAPGCGTVVRLRVPLG